MFQQHLIHTGLSTEHVDTIIAVAQSFEASATTPAEKGQDNGKDEQGDTSVSAGPAGAV